MIPITGVDNPDRTLWVRCFDWPACREKPADYSRYLRWTSSDGRVNYSPWWTSLAWPLGITFAPPITLLVIGVGTLWTKRGFSP